MRACLTQSLPFLCIMLVLSTRCAGESIGTAFSYRGSLSVGGMPAAGTYDLRFALFDDLTNGLQVAPAITNIGISMNNGVFNVQLDFGQGVFTGERRWLEIAVRTNSSAEDFEILTPRQEIGAGPYALYAARAGVANMAQNVSAEALSEPLNLTNKSNVVEGTFGGDGSALTGVDAASFGGQGVTNFWQRTGNAGTTAGVQFLGTTDNQPLELKVNGERGLRLEPLDDGSVNILCGSSNNVLGGYCYGVTIGGGNGNSIWEGTLNTISGGESNVIGDTWNFGGATICGGSGNEMNHICDWSTIAGGTQNTLVYAVASMIGGGSGNLIDSQGDAVIGGGSGNRIGDYANLGYGSGNEATIGGGSGNFNTQNFGTVAGGFSNSITNLPQWLGQQYYSGAIGGGASNVVNGTCGTIPGGANNVATNFAFAAGYRAKATNEGAFVWASGNTNDFPSTADDSFQIYAPGRFEVDWGGQDANGHGLKWIALAAQTPGRVINAYNGAYLSTGGNWVDVSDRNAKKDFREVNSGEILERVSKLAITTWSYRAEDPSARHLGPVAQDFHAAFGLGADDKHISALDSSGVALAAIQGLNQKLEAKEARIKALEQSVDELKEQVRALLQSRGGSQ